MLRRQRHCREDVAVTHMRVVKPGVTEAIFLGHLHVLPGANICWIADSELHWRGPPRSRIFQARTVAGTPAKRARAVHSIALPTDKRNARQAQQAVTPGPVISYPPAY